MTTFSHPKNLGSGGCVQTTEEVDPISLLQANTRQPLITHQYKEVTLPASVTHTYVMTSVAASTASSHSTLVQCSNEQCLCTYNPYVICPPKRIAQVPGMDPKGCTLDSYTYYLATCNSPKVLCTLVQGQTQKVFACSSSLQ